MTSPFVINDLPDGTYSVCWPGYEYTVVNNPGTALKLLEILFDVVGVDEAMIGLYERGRDNDWRTWYISNMVWLEDQSRKLMASRISDYVVPGVKFTDIYQAEKFKDHMEKLLAWKQLSNGQAWA
jgi:hypothetical protein